MNKEDLNKGKIVYFARIVPQTNIYEVCELTIRTIADDYFVGVDNRDKHAHLLTYDTLNKVVFINRNTALKIVHEAEKDREERCSETYYEEY